MIKFENKENGRYYYLYIEQDLFDDLVLIVIRGGHDISVTRRVSYHCRETIQTEIDKLSKRRIARGYTLIS